MGGRDAGLVGALLLVIGVIWVFVPPFPSPRGLVDLSLLDLEREVGLPKESTPFSVTWYRSRGIAFWTLQADWYKGQVITSSRPDWVARCLRFKWVPEWVGRTPSGPSRFSASGQANYLACFAAAERLAVVIALSESAHVGSLVGHCREWPLRHGHWSRRSSPLIQCRHPGRLPSLHRYYGLISNTTPAFDAPPLLAVPYRLPFQSRITPTYGLPPSVPPRGTCQWA
jgi:hypothetical protein